MMMCSLSRVVNFDACARQLLSLALDLARSSAPDVCARSPPSKRACRRTACLPSAGLNDLLSVNVCGSGRPCQLPQQSHAPVTPRRHDVPRCSRSHHTLAVARAPPVFFNAMIYQQQCCASVAHRAPTPRLAQLRPRSLCARSRPRLAVQTDNFFSGPTVSTVSEGLLFVP